MATEGAVAISEMTEDQLLAEIAACKSILEDYDYKQLKYFRGDLTEDEWQEALPLIRERVARINDCEQELETRESARE